MGLAISKQKLIQNGIISASLSFGPDGMSTTNTHSQTYWQRAISHVMSGTIFFTCLTSAISAYFAALRISALPAALKQWRKGCNKRMEKRELWQSQNRRWTCLACCGKIFDCAKSNDVQPGFEDWSKFFGCAESKCIQPSGDTQSTQSEKIWYFKRVWGTP